MKLNETKGTIHGYDSALKTQIARNNIEKRILFLKKCFNSSDNALDHAAERSQ